MSDLRRRLERLGERAEVAPDAFERLERARRRHERNRRITAGFVALLVAIAGSLVAFSAFRAGGGVQPGGGGGTSGRVTGPSNVAEFTCGGSGSIAPASLTVDAQADGVHIAVTNTGAEPVSFTVASLAPPSHVVGGDGADPGERKETVWQLPPGDASVSCSLASADGTDTSPTAQLSIDDPTGSYVPVDMTCPTSGQIPEYAEGTVGFQGDPVQVARQHLSGLEYDDTVARAGYPNSREPVIRVVRDGNVVALATLRSDGRGGWLDDHLEVCVNVLIGWSEEITGVSGPMGSPTPPTAWGALCGAARADSPNSVHNGSELHLDGRDFDFDTRCLIAPAGRPLTILFSNLDGGIPRNISVYPLTPYLRECIVTGTAPGSDPGHALFTGDLITGVDEIVYELGPFEPGEYYFQDDVHPAANGVLVVE